MERTRATKVSSDLLSSSAEASVGDAVAVAVEVDEVLAVAVAEVLVAERVARKTKHVARDAEDREAHYKEVARVPTSRISSLSVRSK